MVDKNNRKQYAEEQFDLGWACYEKGEPAKAIEHWSNIQWNDDNETYANAQYNLGVVYQEQGELTKAIEHWGNVQREDDKEAYAQAQFNLGVVYKEQGDFAKAIEHWGNIQHEDDKKAYAQAQVNLGVVYQEQANLAKAIEHWAKVRREDDKVQYAQAQYNLGLIYQEQGNLAKAIEHWGNIQRVDDKKAYAQAQYNLGLIYQEQGNLAKAIEHWGKIQRVDDKKQYAQAQFNLGLIYQEQGNLAKAIEHWGNIQCGDDKKQYAQAQFNLGLIYQEQGDLAKAIEHWGKIQRVDDKETYAQAQYNLGRFYYEQGKLTKAIEHWANVQREDDKGLYAKAQVNLGVLYDRQGSFSKAIEHWANVQREDHKGAYAQAQLNLGAVYYDKDELAQAKKYTEEALTQQENSFLKASMLLDQIALLQDYAKGKKSDDYTLLKHGLNQIMVDVNEILELLIIKFEVRKPERKVATYTKVEVAKIFIEKKEKSFHLNIANRMNDKTEGQNLFKLMGYQENTGATDTTYGFLTSFTFNHNSLNQFRLYGKTEDKEGTGVSFVVSTEIFSDKHSDNYMELNTDALTVSVKSDVVPQSNQDQEKDKKLITEKIPLYRCIYINPDNGYVNLARRSRYSFFLEYGDLEGKTRSSVRNRKLYNGYKKDMDQLEKKVREILQNIKANYQQINALADEKQLKQATDQLIRKILLPLCFLTKHAAFEEEAECRIIYITDIANKKVTFENDRFFVAYGVPVLDRQRGKTYLDKIYLGPKVEDVVKIELQHLYYQQGISKPIKIEKSHLPLA